MRRRLTLLACLFMMAFFVATPLCPAAVAASESTRPDLAANAAADPDHVIVRFKDSTSESKINSLEAKHKLTETGSLDENGTVLYDVGTSETPATVAQKLYATGTVEVAEPDYTMHINGATNDTLIDK